MKRIWILIIIVVVILGIIFIPKFFFNKGGSNVEFETLNKSDVPSKIAELLPRYMTEERALACKVDQYVYVVVTRGEKRTDGYSVAVDRIEKVQVDDGFNLVVYAKYKDPKPDEIVPQVITYPVVVVKTELEELPKKIELQTEYIE